VAEEDTVVAEEDTVVAEEGAIVAEEDTVVAEEDTVVAEEDTVVAEEDTVVAEEGAIVAEEDADVAEEETRDSYIYLGGAFSIGIDNFDGTAGLSSSDEGFGFDFWLGYRINRYVGVEGRISHISGFDAQFEGEAIDFQMFSFTGNVKVYPITGIFQPYAILGIGSADFKGQSLSYERNDTGVLVVVGGGIDIYVLDRFSVMAELDYIVTVGDVKGLDQIQAKAGIQFQF
jgi:opacity protein-like surface antigen